MASPTMIQIDLINLNILRENDGNKILNKRGRNLMIDTFIKKNKKYCNNAKINKEEFGNTKMKYFLFAIILVFSLGCKNKECPQEKRIQPSSKKENAKRILKNKKSIIKNSSIKKKDINLDYVLMKKCKVDHNCPTLCCWDNRDKKSLSSPVKKKKGIAYTKSSGDGYKKIKTELKKLRNDSLIKNGLFGFAVKSIKSNKWYFRVNSRKLFAPASNMKLVTTGAALELLKPTYKMKTFVNYNGLIENGVLTGDIILKGGGDPSFCSERSGAITAETFKQRLKNALSRKKITKIKGNILIDNTYFSDYSIPSTWEWIDLGESFAPPVSAVSVFENTLTAFFKPNLKIKSKSEFLKIVPRADYLSLKYNIETVKKKFRSSFTTYGFPGVLERKIAGKISTKKIKRLKGKDLAIEMSMPDPPLHSSYFLKQILKEIGVTFKGRIQIVNFPKKVKKNGQMNLLTLKSPPISQIVYWTNRESLNLFAETLVKIIGIELGGKGTTDEGVTQIMKFWNDKGVYSNQLSMVDGSGLARTNLISPSSIIKVLSHMAKSKYYRPFRYSMPIVGVSGNVWRLGQGENNHLHNNMRLKTGYINRVRAFSGYVDTLSGDTVAFTILVNDYLYSAYKMRSLLYPILKALPDL
jgi:serine-type D-Ala-D-Ala carboxypeptidase/endopeptidase (penicillin-binding protein 4)